MKWRWRGVAWGLFLCALVLVGCGGAEETAVGPTATPDPVLVMQAALQETAAAQTVGRADQLARWLEELDAAEARWQNAGVTAYRIEVLYINSPRSIGQRHTVTVRDGRIVEETADCANQNNDCILAQIDVNSVTAPGLFGMARSAIEADEITDNGTEFNFDPEYGVPEWISLKTNGQFPWYWHVEAFEPLSE